MGSYCLKRLRISVCCDENILEMVVTMAQHCEYTPKVITVLSFM